jgi:4-hydroxybenzoate polyprenyltransferase
MVGCCSKKKKNSSRIQSGQNFVTVAFHDLFLFVVAAVLLLLLLFFRNSLFFTILLSAFFLCVYSVGIFFKLKKTQFMVEWIG